MEKRELKESKKLEELELECKQEGCKLTLINLEDDAKGGVELFCSNCNLSVIGDSLYEVTEELRDNYWEK